MKKITSVITAIIGIIVIIMGVSFMNNTSNYSVSGGSFQFSPPNFDVEGAKFGADFYTYMYGASDTIVEELDSLNQAMEVMVDAQNSIKAATAVNARATCVTGGMIVIAIGLAILAYATQAIGVAFFTVDPKPVVQQPVVQQPVAAPKTSPAPAPQQTTEKKDPELKKKCNHCGYSNPNNLSFCENCGHSLKDVEASVPAKNSDNEQLADYWICGKCKTKNLNTRDTCWSCGQAK